MKKGRTLFLDLEVSPILAWTYALYDTNVVAVEEDWFVLAFSAKQDGVSKTYALPDYPRYKRNKKDDKDLVKDLWHVLDEADIVCAHNAPFDIKKSNTRFIYHGFPEPSHYQVVDTLKEARKHFKFTSNKLDDLARYLGLQGKTDHHSHLWRDCIAGDKKAWERMKAYNKDDVEILEQVYEKLLPWMTSHPNMNLFDGDGCPACGSSDYIKKGHRRTITAIYQGFQCRACGKKFQGTEKKNEKVPAK